MLGRRSALVRRLRRLVRQRSERADHGLIVLEGTRGVETALDAGATFDAVLAGPDADPALLARLGEAGAAVHPVAENVIEQVADTVTPQGIVAAVHHNFPSLDSLDDLSLTLVLVDVRDPGNVGTLIRTAEAAGAAAVVLCRGSADASSPKVVRASAGALFHVPVVQGADAQEVLDVLAQRGVRRLGTVAHGGERHDRADWSSPCALVLGNEGWGIPVALEPAIDAWITVPLAGRAESLNVAAAGAVLLFEARRDRGES